MLNKQFFLFILFSACFFSCGYYKSSFSDTDFSKAEIKSNVVMFDNKPKIEIFVDGKLYMGLQVIPEIKPYKSFASVSDAQKVADLLVDKLRRQEIPPKVTLKELEQLGISY